MSIQRAQTQRPAVKLPQVIAFMLVSWRIFVASLVGPVTVAVFPLVVLLMGWISTSTNGLLTLLLWLSFYTGFTLVVRRMTPTKKDYDDCMARLSSRYLFQSFLLTILVIRFFVFPLSETLGVSIAWYPDVFSFFRFSTTLLVIELSVIARYIGPQSIMRCSSFPLASSPLVSFLRFIVKQAIDVFLPPTHINKHASTGFLPGSSSRWRGRRFRYPSFLTFIAHTIIAIFSGFALFYGGFVCENNRPIGFALASSIFTMLLPLAWFVAWDDHELDPCLYSGGMERTYINVCFRLFRGALVSSAMAIGMTFVTVYLSNQSFPDNWALMSGRLFVSLLLLSLWSFLFDDMLRRIILFETNFEEDVGTTIRCLIENETISERALSTGAQGAMGLHQTHLVEALITDMGIHLTTRVENQVECPLEQDVLRFLILRAMGGGGGDKKFSSIESLWIPDRQRENIYKYVVANYSSTAFLFGQHRTHILIRGLCVFAGGLGEALRLASEKQVFRFREERWTVPPAMITEMQFTVRALLRILHVVSTCSGQSSSVQLSILVPEVVTALFRLRSGIYSMKGVNNGEASNFQANAMLSLRLDEIVEQCDNAAVLVWSTQSNTTESIRTLPVDKMTAQWLQMCVSGS